MRKWLYTLNGNSFGYSENGLLRLHNGEHVGSFDGNEIYNSNGLYLGELIAGNRIAKNTAKRKKISPKRYTKQCKELGQPHKFNIPKLIPIPDGFEEFEL